MSTPAGQIDWGSAYDSTKAYIVRPEVELKMYYEFRQQSAVGKLARMIPEKMTSAGPEGNGGDVASSAAIQTCVIVKGDEKRFTLEQKLGGSVVYGDSTVPAGDYTAYLQANVILNQIKSPGFPIPEDMSLQRVKEVISTPEANLRTQIELYFAEQYTQDFYDGALRGASRNLLASRAIGGRALDLGAGAGVQVSPANFVVAGNGFVSGVSGTSGYETNVVTALGNLTNDTSHMISREKIFDLSQQFSQRQIAPVLSDDGGTKEKFYVACDPLLLARLKRPGNTYSTQLQFAMERGKENPVFVPGAIELDNMVFFPDPWLQKFRPDISSGSLVWGTNSDDKRNFVSSSNIAMMVVLGRNAVLEGTNGQLEIRMKEGDYGDGKSWGGRIKQSFQRMRWVPKDGRGLSSTSVKEQGMLAMAFYEDGSNL